MEKPLGLQKALGNGKSCEGADQWSKLNLLACNLVGIELTYFNAVSHQLGSSAMRQLGNLAALTLLGRSFCYDKSNDISYASRQLNNWATWQLGNFTNSDNAIA